MTPKSIARLAAAVVATLPFMGAAGAADLLDIYREAISRDPVFASARASYAAGKEALPIARSNILPLIGITGTGLRNTRDTDGFSSLDYNTRGYTLSLSQPLFRPQNWIAVDQAGYQVQQTDAIFYDAQQALILRAAQAYFDVLLAQDNVTLSAAQKTAISEQLAQAKRNFEVGTATIVDTYEAQARYDLAVAKEISDQNDLEIKKRALQQLIGRMPDSFAPLKPQLALPLPTPIDMDAWVTAADKDSPVVQQFVAAFEFARKEVDRNRAAHLPTVDLIGTFGDSRSPITFADGTLAGTPNTRATGIGVQFSVPIFQGGGVQARVRQAVALRDRAEQDLENTRRTVAQNVRQSFLGVTNGAAQVKALESARASNQSSLESTVLGREVGVRTGVDVLNAQQQLFQAERDLQSARYNTILSQLRLKAATGRLGEEDLAEVNRLLEK